MDAITRVRLARGIALLCAAALLVAGCSRTPVEEDVVVGELGGRLDEYLTRVTPFGFSGALLVSRDGEIILNKGYGMANRAEGLPNTAATVFSTGSITKQFTAAAIMKLEMDGRLRATNLLSSFIEGVPDDKSGIRLHHLLTHTAGVVESTGPDYEEVGRDDVVARILESPLAFEPGGRFAYSNAGYSLLAAVVEMVSGRSYEAYLRDELFSPAGMKHTGYRLPDWTRSVVANWYVGDTDNGNPLGKPYPYWNLLGNGGILSTTGDMLLRSRALEGEAVLSTETKRKLFAPFLEGYAYGWDIVATDLGMLVQHDGGSMLGSSAELRWYLDAGVVTVLFCNQSFGNQPLMSAVRDDIEAIVFGGGVEMPPAATSLDDDLARAFEGRYIFDTGGGLRVAAEGGYLRFTTADQDAINALFFPGETDPKQYQDLNLRSNALVAGAVRGDVRPFEREFANGETAARVLDMLSGEIAQFADAVGSPARMARTLGTVPGPNEGVLLTGVRVLTESGEAWDMSFVWRDGRLEGLDQLAYEVSVPFGAVSETELVGYHLFFARSVRAIPATGTDGSVTALVFPHESGGSVARKLPEHDHGHDDAEHADDER